MSSFTLPRIANIADIPSPALILDLAAIDENLRRMLAIVGKPERLRPHMKTHKLPQLIERQIKLGITKFKCSTIAEAEMVAGCAAADVFLASQPVGANAERYVKLVQAFPKVRFTAMVDDETAIRALSTLAEKAGLTLELFLDLDVGQHRTGVAPGDQALELYKLLGMLPNLRPAGLHAYDGHLQESDLEARRRSADAAFLPVMNLRQRLMAVGAKVPRMVVGGTPTFPIHAQNPLVECSPGTCVLWDAGYATKLPDLDFLPAAWLLTRVVSRPGENRLCLDLGHKAVASEMPHPRVVFPALPEAKAVVHSEEHLVLETPRAEEIPVGQVLRGVPWHVCPTVALHSEVYVLENGVASTRWPVVARARRLTV